MEIKVAKKFGLGYYTLDWSWMLPKGFLEKNIYDSFVLAMSYGLC